jgi:hypothetical protein
MSSFWRIHNEKLTKMLDYLRHVRLYGGNIYRVAEACPEEHIFMKSSPKNEPSKLNLEVSFAIKDWKVPTICYFSRTFSYLEPGGKETVASFS